MEFDISKTVEEIAMQAKENQEEFIFDIIQPYCENILQIKINKEKLKQILLNGMQKQQPCEDCISREEAIRIAEQGQIQGFEWQFKELCNLSPVTPKARCIPDRIVIDKNLCDSCITKGCIFQSGIIRSHCEFYKAESEE